MAARNNGCAAEKPGFADARGAKERDVEKEVNRYKAFTLDEAMLTSPMVMAESGEFDNR